ncbi:peptidase S8/S53 domain-containing protein, partial [Syncephalis pseudoplumigaleata]
GSDGDGVRVGIIDSGVDYNHPALGGCFGGSCKIGWGYDFVGDEYTGFNEPVPKETPLDTCHGHGTHVAGIIAGDSHNFTGIVPRARLGIYRVIGCKNVASVNVFVAAM